MDEQAQQPYSSPLTRRPGRPLGSVNYSGVSLVAKALKAHGVMWLDEMAECYKRYRAESLALTASQRAGGQTPDQTMIRFWIEALPYISLKMTDKAKRGWKPQKSKHGVTKAGMKALRELEGRPLDD